MEDNDSPFARDPPVVLASSQTTFANVVCEVANAQQIRAAQTAKYSASINALREYPFDRLHPVQFRDSAGKRTALVIKKPRAGDPAARAIGARMIGNHRAVLAHLTEEPHKNVAEIFTEEAVEVEWHNGDGEFCGKDVESESVVMEAVGVTLKEWLYGDGSANACTYSELINVFLDVARGLEHSHENQVVLRALNPCCVQISDNGRAKIVDYDHAEIAKVPSVDWNLCGVFGYMAPELFCPKFNGERLKITKSIDEYALGAIMLECLTRKPPSIAMFEEADREQLAWKAIEECCKPYVSAEERIFLGTTDPTVLENLLHKLPEDWFYAMHPWPKEFWSLLGEGNIRPTEENASAVIKELESMNGEEWDADRFPWPPKLCLLIAECLSLSRNAGKNAVVRPRACQIVRQLEAMLKDRWAGDFVPWSQDSGSKEDKLVEGLAAGCCVIPDSGLELGRGAFAKVQKALFRDSQGNVHVVAVKRTNNPCESDAYKAIKNELEIWGSMTGPHANVVHCFGGNLGGADVPSGRLEKINMGDSQHFLVLEYVPQNLRKLIYEDTDFAQSCTYGKLIEIFIGMAKGLKFLNDNGIIHFDLKPENVLIDENLVAKLTDFNLSKIRWTWSVTHTRRGSCGYMAPEMFLPFYSNGKRSIHKDVDIYSLGAIMAECVVRRHPPPVSKDTEPTELWSLIGECCSGNFDGIRPDRPTAVDIVERLEGMRGAEWIDNQPWNVNAEGYSTEESMGFMQ